VQLDIISLEKGDKTAEKLSLADDVFAAPFSEGLVHQVITSYMAAARTGSKSNLGRSEVRGGGAKPWRQKGSGRARAGTKNSPIWRGGGVTFAATPRNYEKKVNRKMYRGALRCIISEQLRRGSITVVDTLALQSHKSRDLLSTLSKTDITEGLFVEEVLSENLYYATRNIPKLWAIDFTSINPYDLYTSNKLIITAAVMKKIEEWLS
jgi:large subunit ribosomal protein L4